MPDYTKQLTFKTLPNGDVAAMLVLTFPGGAKRIFREVLNADDRKRAVISFARLEGGAIAGSTCRQMIGAASDESRKGEHPSVWWWRISDKTRAGKRVDDDDARVKWWNALGRSSRSTIRAFQVEGPKGGSAAEKEAWWAKLGKKRRGLARERHGGPGGGFLSDVVKTVKSVDRAFDKTVLGKAFQVAMPVFAVGKWSIKNPAKAAAFLPGGSSAAEAIKTGVQYLPAAKKLAAGKVMDAASKSLAITANNAVGAGAARELGVASKLAAADAALSLGTKGAAKKLVGAAKKKLAGVSPSLAKAAYNLANTTRKNIAVLAGDKKRKPAPVLAIDKNGKPTKAPPFRKAARDGVLSNVKGPVSETELARAMKAGRVFFIVKRAA